MEKDISMKDIYSDKRIRQKPYPICPNCGGPIKITRTAIASILICINCNHKYYCTDIYTGIEEWNQYCREYKYSSKKIFIISVILGLTINCIYGFPYSIFVFGLIWSILSLIDQYKVTETIDNTIIEALDNVDKECSKINSSKITFNIQQLKYVDYDILDIINECNNKINQYCRKHNESVPNSIIKYNMQIESMLKILQDNNELCNDKNYIDTINKTLYKYWLLFNNEYTKLIDNANIYNRAQIQVIQEDVNSEYEYLNIFHKDKLDNILKYK